MKQKEMQAKYKPETMRYIFIGEAFPCADDQFFYYEDVSKQDNLFLYLVRSIFDDLQNIDAKQLRLNKKTVLQRMREEGYYVDFSVDSIVQKGTKNSEKQKIIRSNTSRLLERLAPYKHNAQIILLTTGVFSLLYDHFISNGFTVVNTFPIPYPGSGQQGKFKESMSKIGFGGAK